MTRHSWSLPSLSALVAFEAAARHLSFKAAALELNVTPGAVSHQIKLLEREIGSPLFERRHRQVVLTENGAAFFETVNRSFAAISSSAEKLKRRMDSASVTIRATTAVSSLWLTPRLKKFWFAYPDIAINQSVSDLVADRLEGADLHIVYGRAERERQHAHRLFRDRLVPLCSPILFERFSGYALGMLATGPLIHLQSHNSRWTTWRRWFSELGHEGDINTAMQVNNYMIALQAAQDDGGIVLGWERLTRPLIDNGSLVALPQFSIEAPHAFYVVETNFDQSSEDVSNTRSWLVENR